MLFNILDTFNIHLYEKIVPSHLKIADLALVIFLQLEDVWKNDY